MQIHDDLSQQVFFAQMTSCTVHNDVTYHPFPINSQHLKTWGVDSPEHSTRANQQWFPQHQETPSQNRTANFAGKVFPFETEAAHIFK